MAFSGTGKIWMNGTLVDWADAKIHIASHVIHYGSGVFEGARCYDTPRGSACFRLDAHMRRLFDSARSTGWSRSWTVRRITDAVLETIRANDYKACYIRPDHLSRLPRRSASTRSRARWTPPSSCGSGAPISDRTRSRTASTCGSAPGRGRAPNTFPTLAKTSANYANSQLIKMEAVAEGYSEGIALDTAGYLSEGSGQNLFVVRDNVIYTPPLTASILPGITRDSVHHAGDGPRVRRPRRNAAARDALHRRRGVLRRHGGRDHADPLGRQDRRRQRPARPDHRGPPAGVLRRHQRRGAGPARLAELRVSRRTAADGGRGRSQEQRRASTASA